jgi:hypothetical protein
VTTVVFLIVCITINLFFKDYDKIVFSEGNQIVDNTNKKNVVKHISNGVEIKTTLKRYYFNILDMEKGKVYDREMISEQAKKQYLFNEDGVKAGYKTKYSNKDIQMAQDYILTYYEYIVHLN